MWFARILLRLFFEKLFKKSKYLFKTLAIALFCFKVANCAIYKKKIMIYIRKTFKVIICTTKVFNFSFNGTLANVFISTNFTYFVVSKVLAVL